MEELNGITMGATDWSDKFDKLKHDYKHHIDEEEDEVFTPAREVIDDAEIEGYGSRFLQRKSEEAELIVEKRADSLEN